MLENQRKILGLLFKGQEAPAKDPNAKSVNRKKASALNGFAGLPSQVDLIPKKQKTYSQIQCISQPKFQLQSHAQILQQVQSL